MVSPVRGEVLLGPLASELVVAVAVAELDAPALGANPPSP